MSSSTRKLETLIDDFVVYTYSPEMLVAEKLRAICQQMPDYVAFIKLHPRARARDFLDIYTVVEHFEIDLGSERFHDLVSRVFDAKRVAISLLMQLNDATVREFHRPDFTSLIATVRPGSQLNDYDFYYDYVAAKCELLKPLWNV